MYTNQAPAPVSPAAWRQVSRPGNERDGQPGQWASPVSGRRRQMLLSFAVLPPLGMLFLAVPGWVGYGALVVLGAAVLSSFAVTVVIAQELMPARLGTASGLVLGLGFGVGGMAVAVLGAVADAVGLVPTLTFLFLLPLAGLALAAGTGT